MLVCGGYGTDFCDQYIKTGNFKKLNEKKKAEPNKCLTSSLYGLARVFHSERMYCET